MEGHHDCRRHINTQQGRRTTVVACHANYSCTCVWNEPECVLCDLLRYLHYRVSDLSGLTDQSRGTLYLSPRLRAADLANLPARPDREFRLGLVHRTDLRASI